MLRKNNSAVTEFILLGLSNDPTIQIVLFITFLAMHLIILAANSLIILATITDAKLQTPMYFFLTNLALVDIIFSSTIILRMLRDLLAAKRIIQYGECVAQMYIYLTVGSTECLLLVVLAYDRYIAICYPLHYTTIINRSACIKIAVGSWIGGFLFICPPVTLTWSLDFCGPNVINHYFCEMPEILSLGCGDVMMVEFVIFVIASIILLLPITFIVMTYILIIRNIFKLSTYEGRRKTFSTCGSHIIVVTMYYGSSVAAYMKPRSKSSADTDKLFAIFYNTVTPMLNPLIYTLRNKDVKAALRSFKLIGIL
ncbi:olfactory receptor 2D3-like [Gastrophryne carolinensis]